MILAKNFILSSERGISLQLRMESDNVFNHTQFSNPTSTYGSSVFGQISVGSRGPAVPAGNEDLLLAVTDHSEQKAPSGAFSFWNCRESGVRLRIGVREAKSRPLQEFPHGT